MAPLSVLAASLHPWPAAPSLLLPPWRRAGWWQVDLVEECPTLALQVCMRRRPLPLAAQLLCPRAPALPLLCPRAPALLLLPPWRRAGWWQVDLAEECPTLALQGCMRRRPLPLAAQLLCPRAPAPPLLCPRAPVPPLLCPRAPALLLPPTCRQQTPPVSTTTPDARSATALLMASNALPSPRATTCSTLAASTSGLLPRCRATIFAARSVAIAWARPSRLPLECAPPRSTSPMSTPTASRAPF
jgi:hypothetical protein